MRNFDPDYIRKRQRSTARTTVIAGAVLLLVGLWLSLYCVLGYLVMIAGFIMVDWTLQNYGKGLFRNNVPPADKRWWKK